MPIQPLLVSCAFCTRMHTHTHTHAHTLSLSLSHTQHWPQPPKQAHTLSLSLTLSHTRHWPQPPKRGRRRYAAPAGWPRPSITECCRCVWLSVCVSKCVCVMLWLVLRSLLLICPSCYSSPFSCCSCCCCTAAWGDAHTCSHTCKHTHTYLNTHTQTMLDRESERLRCRDHGALFRHDAFHRSLLACCLEVNEI